MENIAIHNKEEKEALLESAAALGKQGIVFSTMITRGECAYVLHEVLKVFNQEISLHSNKIEDDDKIRIYQHMSETAVERIYTIDDGKYYNIMKNYIVVNLKDDLILNECINQLFKAFESELYYPCLCGSLPVIERIIKDNDNLEEYRPKILFGKIKESKACSNLEDELHIANIEGFIEYVYHYVDFSSDESFEFNRNRYLHGRLIRIPNKVDCLKLFSVIYSLIELMEMI